MNQAGVAGKLFGFHQFFGINRHRSTLRRSLGRILVIMGIAALTLFALAPAGAADGGLDLSFAPGAGVGRATILWGQYYYTYAGANGLSLIAGAFTTVDGVPRSHIARINGNGSLDTSFNAAVDGLEVDNVYLLNPGLADSKILIVGPFSIASSGGTYNGLARLNSDGTVDTTFAHTFASTAGVQGIAVQPDGYILVIGYSMVVNNHSGVYCLLRLTPDGQVDGSYPMVPDSGSYIHNVTAYPADDPNYPNGARLCGTIPRFYVEGSSHMDHILILDHDGNRVASLGDEYVDGPIIHAAHYNDGRTLIAGLFTQVYGASRNGVARLSAGLGSRDDSFDPGNGANHLVRRVNIQSDGKIVLAGFFTSFNNDTSRKYLVRLSSAGVIDNSFNPGTGPDDCVWSMWQRTDTTWMVLGTFRTFNGSTRHGIANLTADGGLNPAYGTVTTANTTIGKVYATALQSDGKILIGGGFSSCGGKYHGGIARLNANGTTDASFQGRASGNVRRIAVQPDGKILVAGGLSSTTGYMARTGVARMNPDGTMDNTFNPKVLRPDGSYADLAYVRVLDNGQIMIAGDFSTVGSVGRTIAARLNSNGTLDTSFTVGLTLPGTNMGGVRVLPAAGDKHMLLGNYLPTGGSTTQGFLTRLLSSGENDPSWGPSPNQGMNIVGMNAASSAMLPQPDGKVLVCGDFTQIFAGSVTNRSHIARITAAGQLDNTFIPVATDNSIKTIDFQLSGKVLIGGAFTSPYNRVARLTPTGSLDPTFAPGSGLDGTVNNVVHIPAQGKALIAGEFTTFNGSSRPGIARLFAGDGKFPPGVLLLLE